jgi:CSLREA domain-containing protein
VGALAAPAAQAAEYVVTSKADPGDGVCDVPACTLREATAAAEATTEPDRIVFASQITGEITLQDEIALRNPIAIEGPGAETLAISGDSDADGQPDFDTATDTGDTRIFHFRTPPFFPVASSSITGLTLHEGVASAWGICCYGYSYGPRGSSGGAIEVSNVNLTLDRVVLSNNLATLDGGGIHAAYFEDSRIVMRNSVISGNSALDDGGGASVRGGLGPESVISATRFTGNRASVSIDRFYDHDYGRQGGGLDGSHVVVTGSTLARNHADFGGGAVLEYGSSIRRTVVRSNSAPEGAGGLALWESAAARITVAGNRADKASGAGGGGVWLEGGSLRDSTISGNRALRGGGIYILARGYAARDGGHSEVISSTVTGNTAPRLDTGSSLKEGVGGGILVRDESFPRSRETVIIENSTVAGNHAAAIGGGLMVIGETTPHAPLVGLSSTILGGNSAGARRRPQDLHQRVPRLVAAGFSLITRAGRRAIRSLPRRTNIIGKRPRLRPLADNGGLTKTRRPRAGSPAIDAGRANDLGRDQRGRPRMFDRREPNARGSDGTDIGAFELR